MEEHTPQKSLSDETKKYIKLRRCIMKTLYEYFKAYPYASIELSQIEEDCHTDSKNLNWNLVYLEKCGYVELDKSTGCPPYVSCLATITAEGIDFVEDESALNNRFRIDSGQ